MQNTKTCSCCNTPKTLDNFHSHKTGKYGKRGICKPCRINKQLEYQKDNFVVSSYRADWYQENKERIQASYDKKAKMRYNKEYAVLNSGKMNAKSAKRKAAKLKATPVWLNQDQLKSIEELYWLAKDLKAVSGETYHVDHIIPLQGKGVCGLHVPWNLQILPADINIRKRNNVEFCYD